MSRRKQRIVRIIAIVLVCLLVGGTIVTTIISAAQAEEQKPAATERNQFQFTVEYLEEEQALRVSQRLVYTNKSGAHMDAVVFYALGNMFRRESALMYEADDLETVFPAGYAPGGIELESIMVNDIPADWGFQGENEIYLRVACDLEPGASCTFAFDYYLLLTDNRAFLGVYETDCRLSGFCFIPGIWNEKYAEFIMQTPKPFTRFIYTDAADYVLEITLPDDLALAASGTETLLGSENHISTWRIEAQNVRDFALSFGRRYRIGSRETASGVTLKCFTNVRGAADRALDLAEEALSRYEEWFGPFPITEMDFVQSDYPLGFADSSGCAWLSAATLGDDDALAHAIDFSLAQQYIGLSAYTWPLADAWLSDTLCEYMSYRMLEARRGHEAYLEALNQTIVPSLQLTVPGGLTVTSDGALFDSKSYQNVVLNRGVAVMHELRTAMGDEEMLSGLRLFYERGAAQAGALTEMDLVNTLDDASGASWESFLTDWLFNVGDYVNQTIDWFD